MIADSLKRRRPGLDCIFAPPGKKRLLCDKEHNCHLELRQKTTESESSKESLPRSTCTGATKRKQPEEEDSGDRLSDSENCLADRYCDSKRQRTLDCPSTSNHFTDRSSGIPVMHIKSMPQSQPQPAQPQAQSQANGRRGRRKNRNRKKAEPKSAPVVEKNRNLPIVEQPVDSNFNEVNYWRPVLPDIEGELVRFLQEGMEISESTDKMSTCNSCSSSDHEEDNGNAYSSFNFWREPFPEVDLSAVV